MTDPFVASAHVLALDIETVPLASALEAPYPEESRTPPANYKSDEAIAKWREQDRTAWQAARVKECSLHPRLGRIVCVGLHVYGDETVLLAKTEADEPALLRAVWEHLHRAKGRVVTWNGTFDLRFILLRSLAHGILPTLPPSTTSAWFRKYTTYPHFDCKAVLTNWDAPRAGEGLTEWATFLGCAGKTDGVTGAAVAGMVEREAWEELTEYCMADVRATAAVFLKIAPYFG
jgi:predicted PolB exonuclease-like 3'-5' exonuclease